MTADDSILHPPNLPLFQALVQARPYVVVDFWADWCPPCRAIAPLFAELAADPASAGLVAFAKVNVDESQDIALRYDVTAMPTFLFFEHGRPLGQPLRGPPPPALRAYVSAFREMAAAERRAAVDKPAARTAGGEERDEEKPERLEEKTERPEEKPADRAEEKEEVGEKATDDNKQTEEKGQATAEAPDTDGPLHDQDGATLETLIEENPKGGYVLGASAGKRSDWKMSLAG